MAEERLQKLLARGGIASRRAAEALIRDGRVRLNGKIVTELGTKADPWKDKVEVDGKRVVAETPVYYALHKPRGFVTTMSDPEGRPSIRDLLKPYGVTARVFPVGRLDFNTSGLLLLTNDGEFSDGLLHPRRSVPKTYVVKVHGLMEPKHLDIWRSGVELEDGKTLPAEASMIRYEDGKTWFQITIREGRNQQIRRMGEATGFRVMRLARVDFAGISSEGLRPGELRPLTYDELVTLKKDYGVPRKPGAARETLAEFKERPRAAFGARVRVQRAREEERDETPLARAPRRDERPARTDDRPPRREQAPARRGEQTPPRREQAPARRGEQAPARRGEQAPARRDDRPARRDDRPVRRDDRTAPPPRRRR